MKRSYGFLTLFRIILLLSVVFAAHSQDLPPLDEADLEEMENPAPPGTFQRGEPPEDITPPPSPGGRPSIPSRGGRTRARGGSTPAPSKPSGPPNPAFDSVKKRQPRVEFKDALPEDITNENFPELIDSFDYPNADIADVIKAISELTNKNFIVDPQVRGKITIIAPSQITVAEAYKAFLTALQLNGYTVVPSGKFLKIRQTRQSARDSIDIYSGPYTPDVDQLITQIVQLKNIQAGSLDKYIKGLLSKDGNLETYEPTNTLIIADYGSNVKRIAKIISKLDVAGFDEQLAVIPIKHAKASDIAELIEKIINKDSGGSNRRTGRRSFSSGIPRFGSRSGSQGSTGTSVFSLVTADERTNSIIVVGNKAGIRKIKKLVKQLDFDLPPDESGGVFVYYAKNVEAKKIAETLSGIAKSTSGSSSSSTSRSSTNRSGRSSTTSSSGSSSNGGLFGSDVKITANEETNSLIIVASRQDYEVILNLLNKIDIRRDQVYVEAVIMEMQVDRKDNFGLNYYTFDEDSKGLGRAGFTNGRISDLLNVANDNGTILGFASGNTFDIEIPGAGTVTVKSLVGFLNLLKTHSQVNILSTPQVMALDNEEAEIEVGDTIPVGTTVAQGTSTTNTSIQREKATIKLKLKPFISRTDNTVRMNIEQTIKQLSRRQVAASDLARASVVTTDRSVITNIVVGDGDTAVLGGLMREEENFEVNKVPILGDIPLLGWLFKSKSKDTQKINLLIFITPRIIRTKQDHKNMVTRKIDQRIEYIKKNMNGRDPYGKTVDELEKRGVSTRPQDESEVE